MIYGLDLFSGIGGLTTALSKWVIPIAYCESDRYAQSVLLSRMAGGDLPRAPIWDDVCSLDGQSLLLPGVDIIYGGFPCQDISVAGSGAGLAGERSGLFFEISRLVRELSPNFVFLENVPAITTRGGLDVIGEFAKMGYDCRWTIISAGSVGAPHRRERWFLLAHSNRVGGRTQQVEKSRGKSASYTLSTMARKNMWPTPCARDGKDGFSPTAHGRHSESMAVKVHSEGFKGYLNPRFVEMMMGYDLGWTELKDWAMLWFQNKREKRSKS